VCRRALAGRLTAKESTTHDNRHATVSVLSGNNLRLTAVLMIPEVLNSFEHMPPNQKEKQHNPQRHNEGGGIIPHDEDN
jgi:hypothetical protein